MVFLFFYWYKTPRHPNRDYNFMYIDAQALTENILFYYWKTVGNLLYFHSFLSSDFSLSFISCIFPIIYLYNKALRSYLYICMYLLKISLEHILLFIKIGYCWTLCFLLDIILLYVYIYDIYRWPNGWTKLTEFFRELMVTQGVTKAKKIDFFKIICFFQIWLFYSKSNAGHLS